MSLPTGRFHYTITHTLGAGGFGVVDAVRVIESNSIYPVGKPLARKRLNDAWKNEPTAQERFEREIAVIGKLSHTAIVTLGGVNAPGCERCYFMPLYPQSLRALLLSDEGRSGFPWQQMARFGATLANALAYAHMAGVVHRDLKPENILLDKDRRPLIADWGVGHLVHKHSKVLQPALTKAGIGTEFYCSMEQWVTGAGDTTSDVYSLGILLAECVLGAPPVLKFTGAGITSDVVPAISIGAALFNLAIQKMTSILSKDRPQEMSEVEALLIQATELSVSSAI